MNSGWQPLIVGSQRGNAAIVAILSMVLLIVISSGFSFLSSTDIKTAANYRDGVIAQYLAEAGAKRALSEIRKSPAGEWTGETRNFDLGNYEVKPQYEVKPVVNQGVTRVISSIGTANRSTRTVVLTAIADSLYQYVAYSGNTMNLNGVTIAGNIGSNADISLTGGTINGNIDAVGGIYTYNVYAPSQNSAVIPKPIPDFTAQLRQKYKSIGKAVHIREDNSQGYAFWEDFSSLDKKVWYVETKYPLVLVAEKIRGPGVIYCTKAIWIAGATVSNNAVVISERDITVDSGIIDKSLLIAGGDVNVAIARFNGSVIAKGNLSISRSINGEAKLETTEALDNPYLPFTWTSDKIQITVWNSHE